MTPVVVVARLGTHDPAQLAAWSWLWRRLLKGNLPGHRNAPSGEPEASERGTALTGLGGLNGHPHSTTE